MKYLVGTLREEDEHFIVFQKLNDQGKPHNDKIKIKQLTIEGMRFHISTTGHLLVEVEGELNEFLSPKKKE